MVRGDAELWTTTRDGPNDSLKHSNDHIWWVGVYRGSLKYKSVEIRSGYDRVRVKRYVNKEPGYYDFSSFLTKKIENQIITNWRVFWFKKKIEIKKKCRSRFFFQKSKLFQKSFFFQKSRLFRKSKNLKLKKIQVENENFIYKKKNPDITIFQVFWQKKLKIKLSRIEEYFGLKKKIEIEKKCRSTKNPDITIFQVFWQKKLKIKLSRIEEYFG